MSAMSGEYGVLFDMDGVLVDSYQPHFESWRQLAAEHGYVLTEPVFAKTFGKISREVIHELWGEGVGEETIVEYAARKEQYYRDIIAKGIPAVNGLMALLAALQADGAKMSVASSGPPENVDFVLDGLKIRSYFHAAVHGRDVERGKPDPAVFVLAAKKLNLARERCVVIEDAPAGIEAARGAGIQCIALLTSNPRTILEECGPTIIVKDLSEVTPELIKRLITSA